MIEQLEIRQINWPNKFGDKGWFEVVMSNKDGFWFPLVMDSETTDKISGEKRILPKVVKFTSLEQAEKWLIG